MIDQIFEFEGVDDFNIHFTRLHNYLMFIDIKANTLKLFLHYARICMLPNKQVTASDDTIAEMAGMSAKTVSRCRKELVSSGLIQVTEQVGKPYVIKINFTALRKANECFWDTHDFMGQEILSTPDKSSEGVGQKFRGTPDKSSDKELIEKNEDNKNSSLTPQGVGVDFLVSRSGTVHQNAKGKPLCGSSGKHFTESNEGEISCKLCLRKLGLLETKRDFIKDWAATHIFGVDPENVPTSLGFLIGDWRNGIVEVHKTYGTEPGLRYLELWQDWYNDNSDGAEYPQERKKIVKSYTRWYEMMKNRKASPNGNGTPPQGDVSTYRNQPKAWETS